MVNFATPLLLSVPVPSVVEPSLKVTVPPGMPPPGDAAVTVAVKVTACPTVDGLTEEVRAVAVFALLTTWLAPSTCWRCSWCCHRQRP